MTTGSPPSITATTELVVPKSIPMILLMDKVPPKTKVNIGYECLHVKVILHCHCQILTRQGTNLQRNNAERDLCLGGGSVEPLDFLDVFGGRLLGLRGVRLAPIAGDALPDVTGVDVVAENPDSEVDVVL